MKAEENGDDGSDVNVAAATTCGRKAKGRGVD